MVSQYGVATISRMLKNIGLFCKRDLQKRPIFCKETYIFKHPTHRSHPIRCDQPLHSQNALLPHLPPAKIRVLRIFLEHNISGNDWFTGKVWSSSRPSKCNPSSSSSRKNLAFASFSFPPPPPLPRIVGLAGREELLIDGNSGKSVLRRLCIEDTIVTHKKYRGHPRTPTINGSPPNMEKTHKNVYRGFLMYLFHIGGCPFHMCGWFFHISK